MKIEKALQHFATKVKSSSASDSTEGTLLTDRVAGDTAVPRSWKLLETLDEAISIHQPGVNDEIGADAVSGILPCYRFGTSDVAVATGTAFIRFDSSETADSHREDVRRAGFEIQRIPEQQPHTAWVTPVSKRPADGIRQFEALADTPGIVHAELQLLRKRESRSRGGVPGPPPADL